MAISSDSVLVVDIEATCWDERLPPAGQQSEIIEIGLCYYDYREDHLYGKRSILVKPVVSEISDFCTSLTSITAQQVERDGIDFETACAILVEEHLARKLLWASWGDFDRKLFHRQCQRMDVTYPFSNKHMNLKQVFSQLRGQRRVGMARALRKIGLSLTGTHHRGHDDAWNIARILQHLVHQYGSDFIKQHL